MWKRHARYRTLASIAAILVVSLVGAGATAATDGLSATYRGQEVALNDTAAHHCHDGDYPQIRCFDSAVERDLDLVVQTARGAIALGPEPEPPPATYYVTWYEAANYGGSSFTASASYSNLGVLGWSDRISSFKSLNNGRPKWWRDPNFAGTTWQWPAGAQVSYVGAGANDLFSSVANVP